MLFISSLRDPKIISIFTDGAKWKSMAGHCYGD